MKRSLEIKLKEFGNGNRIAATGALTDAGIEVVESKWRIIQVRKTTPTEVRRLLKGIGIDSISEGFKS
jgi:hypothetical protein